MKILALESSAKAVSAAVSENGRILASGYQDTGLTHSRTLMPIVEHILKNTDLKLSDMDAIAVAVGPGSFTGIRIGVSAAKGLAFSVDKPAVGVSTLAAMARNVAFSDGLIVCAMDARRSQVYNANFSSENSILTRLTPDRAVSLDELAEEIRNDPRPITLVGDGAHLAYARFTEQGIPCRMAPPHLIMQNAMSVALCAEDLARAGQMMVFTVSSIVLTLALSALAATLLRLPRSRWGVFVPMAGLSNVLFVGLPLCTQLFGEVCVPYVMVYYLSNTIFTQSLAVVLIERAGSQPGKGGSLAHRMLDMLRKPPIVGMAVSIVLLVLGLRPPELVMRFASQISGSVTPLALIYCGYIVYEVGLKNLRFLQGMPTMLVIRLIVSPLICAAFCMLGGVSGLTMRVFIVESALPVVSQITVMAGAYGADEEYAATGACLSMLGCFFTIPVLMLILS